MARLKKHLQVDDDEPLVISISPMYLNLLVMNDQEVQPEFLQPHTDPASTDENICANNGERVSNNGEILSQDLSSSHAEICIVEGHGDCSLPEDPIEMLSHGAFPENESLNVTNDCEGIGSLNENVEKDPFLESFHSEVIAAVD